MHADQPKNRNPKSPRNPLRWAYSYIEIHENPQAARKKAAGYVALGLGLIVLLLI